MENNKRREKKNNGREVYILASIVEVVQYDYCVRLCLHWWNAHLQ